MEAFALNKGPSEAFQAATQKPQFETLASLPGIPFLGSSEQINNLSSVEEPPIVDYQASAAPQQTRGASCTREDDDDLLFLPDTSAAIAMTVGRLFRILLQNSTHVHDRLWLAC